MRSLDPHGNPRKPDYSMATAACLRAACPCGRRRGGEGNGRIAAKAAMAALTILVNLFDVRSH